MDFLAVQGTHKSLLQHHNSKAPILQLSHPYMNIGKTIGKIIALTRWTIVDKVVSLLFNMLSRLVITLFPRSKCLLISWLQSPSAVIFEPPKIRSVTISPSSICHAVIEPDAKILVFKMLSLSQHFHSPLSLSSKGSLDLHFLPLKWYHLHISPGKLDSSL